MRPVRDAPRRRASADAGDVVDYARSLTLRLAEWSARLVDGEHPWGSAATYPERYGVTRFRLTVYPPAIDAGARRRLRAWRAWPALGLACVLVAVPLATSIPWGVALAAALACYAAGFAVLASLSAPERRAVHELWAMDPGESATADELLAYSRARVLGDLLCAADEALAQGTLSAAGHARVWGHVYRELGEARLETLPQ